MDLMQDCCPGCGGAWPRRNPLLTVDIIIVIGEGPDRGIVLIKRKNPPAGWALPGGFVDYGETVEEAAVREAHEETGLRVELARQFHMYSAPTRDPRGHTVSVVFVATATGEPAGGDDASLAKAFPLDALPSDMAFDHRRIIRDYLEGKY
ncbi:MAG: NUDIX hydrolase [Candidatus Eisenbacteria bacterium]